MFFLEALGQADMKMARYLLSVPNLDLNIKNHENENGFLKACICHVEKSDFIYDLTMNPNIDLNEINSQGQTGLEILLLDVTYITDIKLISYLIEIGCEVSPDCLDSLTQKNLLKQLRAYVKKCENMIEILDELFSEYDVFVCEIIIEFTIGFKNLKKFISDHKQKDVNAIKNVLPALRKNYTNVY